MGRFRVALTFLVVVPAASAVISGTSVSVNYPIKAKGSDPLWRIHRKNLWGYIDRGGNVVIEPRFVGAGDFMKGLASVCVPGPPGRQGDSRCGYIDPTGTFVIEPRFDAGLDFQDGVAPVKLNEGWTLIDTNGEILTDQRFAFIHPFSEGLAVVEVLDPRDTDGKTTLPRHRHGYIDTRGHIVINPVYIGAEPFKEGLAAVRDDSEQWGVIDTSGRVVAGFKYAEVSPFSGGVTTAREALFGKWGVIDAKGNTVRRFDLTWADKFSEGFAAAYDDAGHGLLGPDGRFRFQRAMRDLESPIGGLAKFGEGLSDGFLDVTGNVRVPAIYFSVEPLSDERAVVHDRTTDRYGYIGHTGAIAIPLRFELATEFVDGLALVLLDDTWCYIDRHGTVVARNVWNWGR